MGSDNYSFLQKGYKAIITIEKYDNPYTHTKEDKFNKLSLSFMTNIVKTGLVALTSWGTDNYISLLHDPVRSGSDTSAKILILKIQSPLKLGVFGNIPRLYYRINNGNYSYLNSFYSGNDTLKFRLPGQFPEH